MMKRITIWILVGLLFALPSYALISSIESSRMETASTDPLETVDTETPKCEGRAGMAAHWPMLGGDRSHTNSQLMTTMGIPDVKVKWDRREEVISWGTVAGDFYGNIEGPAPAGREHLVFSTNTQLHVADGATGDDMWVLDIEGLNISSVGDVVGACPAVADFDKNGRMEIILVTDNNLVGEGVLYVFEPNISYNSSGYHWDEGGNLLEDRKLEYAHPGNTVESSPVLGDVNGDGREDAVLMMGNDLVAYDIYRDEEIFVYDRLLGTKMSAPVLLPYSPQDLRTVITTRDGNLLRIYMVDHNGNTAWNKTIPISSSPSSGPVTFLPSPAVGEINLIQDGMEIVVLTPYENGNGNVRVFSKNGELIWARSFEADGQFDASPALADTDDDGLLEIGVISWKAALFPNRIESHAYLLDNGGTLIWDFVKNETTGIEGTVANPVFCRIDENEVPDLVVSTMNTVIALDGDEGGVIWEIAPQSGVLASSPAAGEFDGDGFLDIALEGLVLSNMQIDLTLNGSDIGFSDDDLYRGVEVGIVAMIRNLGVDEARGVEVDFYDGLVLIGNVTIEAIPGEDTRQATIDWVPGAVGQSEIGVLIDPGDSLKETEEDNNRASVTVEVKEALPDLELVGVDFKRKDRVTVDNETTHLVEGEDSYINITVRNSGLSDSAGCIILVEVDHSVLVDRNDLGSIERGGIRYVELRYRFSEGDHRVNVTLDPDGIMIEENDSNNYYERIIGVIDDDPDGASYLVEGHVYRSDLSVASGAEVRVLNTETLDELETVSDSQGAYELDLADLERGYREGDNISIFASLGSESDSNHFYAYSEDKGIVYPILLSEGPSQGFEMIREGPSSIDMAPGQNSVLLFAVHNTGEEERNVVLEEPSMTFENGSSPQGWTASLSGYSLTIGPGKAENVNLTIEIPQTEVHGARVRLIVTGSSDALDSTDRNVTWEVTVKKATPFNLTAVETEKTVMTPFDRTEVDFHLEVENPSSAQEDFDGSISVSPSGLETRPMDPFSVGPGSSEVRNLTAVVKTENSGETFSIELTITARSSGLQRILTFYLFVGTVELELHADDISMLPVRPRIGGKVTLSVRIWNNGTAASPVFPVKLTTDPALDSGIQERNAGPIEAGSFDSVIFQNNLTEYALYSFQLHADPAITAYEEHRDDNKASLTLDLRPDIVIEDAILVESESSKTPMDSVTEGESVYLRITVGNPGDVDLTSSFELAASELPSGKGAELGLLEVDQGITGGDNITVYMELDLSSADVGEFKIHLDADRDDEIVERAELNNRFELSITVKEEKTESPAFDVSRETIIGIVVAVSFVILVIIIMTFKRRKGDPDSEEDIVIVEPISVMPMDESGDEDVDEGVEKTGKKEKADKGAVKRKRSLREILSARQKGKREAAKKDNTERDTGEETGDSDAVTEEMDVDISDIISSSKKDPMDMGILEVLDLDSDEGVEEDEDDFLDKLRGEMRVLGR